MHHLGLSDSQALEQQRFSMPIERVGVIGAANLLKGNHQKPNYLGIPSVVFTVPRSLLSVSAKAGHVKP
jgi:hypothetical protein